MSSKLYISLPSGGKMPAIGFGTWQANDDELEAAVETALEAGYRHIDTAPVYENEHVIGKVLKKWLDAGKLKRSELFIVTKLPPVGNRPGDVEKWIKRSLQKLQLDYIDLYLIHAPFAFVDEGEELHPVNDKGEIKLDTHTNYLKVWSEMEEQVLKNHTKAIGLSNFNINQIKKVLANSKLPVSNLQIELHVYFQQKELVTFCKSNSITVTAYSPLGTRGLVKLLGKTDELPDLLQNPIVKSIAAKYNKSPAQILLKHILQKGVAAIPKSTNAKRIIENIQLFDWELQSEDSNSLNNLNQGEKARICDFSFFKGIQNHPDFPF
ncbi:1,5-anhydro-D-fructose reductase [Prorops nasuta]|uniref:1,5-anhydro-D-fructose reductase n=1 Tax=Prorops nasuta TaxID=863751 RepID=UPI0034CF857E